MTPPKLKNANISSYMVLYQKHDLTDKMYMVSTRTDEMIQVNLNSCMCTKHAVGASTGTTCASVRSGVCGEVWEVALHVQELDNEAVHPRLVKRPHTLHEANMASSFGGHHDNSWVLPHNCFRKCCNVIVNTAVHTKYH